MTPLILPALLIKSYPFLDFPVGFGHQQSTNTKKKKKKRKGEERREFRLVTLEELNKVFGIR